MMNEDRSKMVICSNPVGPVGQPDGPVNLTTIPGWSIGTSDRNEDEDDERDEVIDWDELLEYIYGDDNDYNMYI